MSNLITFDQAAHRATEALRASNDLTLRTSRQEPPRVTSGCISDLAKMHRFTRSDAPGKVDAGEIDEIFARTRILDGVGLSVLRVSIGPLDESGPCDMLRFTDGFRQRRFIGWDFSNIEELSDEEAWAGISGVWAMKEENARQAEAVGATFAPAVKGFIDGSLVRRVVGYTLDLTSRRRWFKLEPLTKFQRDAVFSQDRMGRDFEHLWISVPRGSTSAIEFDKADLNKLRSEPGERDETTASLKLSS